MEDNELIDMDDNLIEHVRNRSRSKDVRGQRVMHINGQEIPLNIPVGDENSDESDLDVDFSTIDSNIKDLEMHSLNLRMRYAVYNDRDQHKFKQLYEQGSKAIKTRKNKSKFDSSRKSRRDSIERMMKGGKG